ncbi:MAG: PAS domain-containing protein [Spirochaetales bacterium]|nr:PAS domain-containing protein [Spirochaetales bacterium]
MKISEEKYRILATNVPGMIYRTGPNWSVEIITNSEAVCGYSTDEFYTKKIDWQSLIHPDDKQGVMDGGAELCIKPTSIVQDYRIIDKNGSTRWVSDHKCSFFKEDGSFRGLVGIVLDSTERKQAENITERKKMENELNQRTSELTQLSSRLRRARENERATIARELHDEFGQALTAVKINIDRLESEFMNQGTTDAMKRLRETSELTDRLLEQVRDLALNLRPSMLDDLGLVAALHWYVRGFSRRTGVECKLQVEGQELLLCDEKRIMIYRAVQEALTNVARHAEAKSAGILLRFGTDLLSVEVKDDGKGFDVDEVFGAQYEKYPFGLLGMRESTEELGGRWRIQSIADQGSSITITIPLGDLQ